MDGIAINKPCKLNFTVFYNVLSYELAAGLSGLYYSMNMCVLLRFQALVYRHLG